LEQSDKKKVKRRDVLKSLATVPILGALAYGIYRKRKYDHYLNTNIASKLGMSTSETQVQLQPECKVSGGKEIRMSIIGYGIRGKMLAKGLGFGYSGMVDEMISVAETNKNDNRYQLFLNQEDLNIQITGVCDIFGTYGNMAQEMGANINREGTGCTTPNTR